MTIQDYPDFQTPQAHATQIAATGVPLLRMTNNLANDFNVTLAGGASMGLLTGAVINQPGYEITIQASMPSGTGTVPFIQVELLWWDGATGLFGARRDVVVTCGNGSSNQLTYYLRGPMCADRFVVNAVNLDPAVTATLTWTISSTSHVYLYHEAVQYAYAGTAPNGFANPLGVPATQLLCKHSPTVAASGTDKVLCALYLGDALLNVDNTGNTVAVTVEMQDPAGLASGTAGATLFKEVVAASSAVSLPVTLPATPVLLEVLNTATVGVSVSEILLGQKH